MQCFPSVFFRVNPWLILLLLLFSCSASASFRVNPWQMLLLILNSVAIILFSCNLTLNLNI